MTTSSRRRSTIRDLLTVVSGTAGSQVIGLLTLPILARTFAPEAFGVFQLYLSLLIFCSVGIALRIELTLVTTADDEVQKTAASLLGLVLLVSLIFMISLSIYDRFGFDLGFPAAFLGLGLVGNGFVQIASYKLIRDQNFARLASLKLSQVLTYAVVAIAIAAFRPTLWGIIVADIAGRLTAGGVALLMMRQGEATGIPTIRFEGMIPFVRRNWELAVISLPGAMANTGGAMLTPLMIFHVYGAAAAGQYGLVDRALAVPVAMIVSAGSQVFLGRVTEQLRVGNSNGALRIFLRIVIVGAVISGAGAVLAWALIPLVFDMVFGSGWEPAIEIARIMIFSYAIVLVTGMVNQTLVALREFRLQSTWDLGWPVCIGTAWVVVVTRGLDLYTAVSFHAVAIGGLGLVFILLCVVKLKRGTLPAVAKEV